MFICRFVDLLIHELDKVKRFGQNGHVAKIKEESSRPGLFERLVPILLVVSIGLAFMVGVLWRKVANLEKGGVAKTAADTQANPTISLDAVKGLFSKDLIKFGDEKRKVLFVEVSDPSCPYCHIAGGKNKALIKGFDKDGTYIAPVPEMKKLVDEGKASYVLIYSPGHGAGEMGMKALYCAYEQGKFWEVNDLIMADAGYALLNDVVKNDKAQSQKIVDFLKGVLDDAKLKECLGSGKYDARLTSDTALATELGISGTPFFTVNATSFPGAYSYKEMKLVVDKALK